MRRSRAAVALGAVLTALSLPASTAALGEPAHVQAGGGLPAGLGAKRAKLDSTLARVAKAKPGSRLVRIEAVARADRRADLEAALRAAGGSTSSRYGTLIEARVPARALETLAAHPAARILRSPHRPHAQVVSGQGVAVTGAAGWHSAETTGAGVEVAIVDLGFAGWKERQAEGELPAQVTTADFCEPGFFDGPEADNHGTAVAEVVHEIAPGAKLHLVCADTLASLGEAKNYVVANDVSIVNHSVAWLNTSRGDGSGGPMTPDGIVADARAQGVLWVNAAGNYAQEHWSGTFSDPDQNGFHNFDGLDEGNEVFLYTDGLACVYLKWDDWPASDQDFDLLLVRVSDDEVVEASTGLQTGSQEPWEELCYTDPAGFAGDYYVVIASDGATAAPRFDLFVTDGQDLEYSVQAGSVIEPATSPAALAVGAVCVHDDALLQPYSSRGPTIDNRLKPDVVAPDANSTVTYGPAADCSSGFAGTSAATPHVTGAAALLKQANPTFGPEQLQAALEGRTVDVSPAGKDNAWGWGRLALGAAPVPPPSAPVNTALPAATGLYHQGQTLTASDGQWTSTVPLLIAFRWFRCDLNGGNCFAIVGARNRTYVPTTADLNRRLRVRVTASNAGGSVHALSTATPPIQTAIQSPANVVPPSLAGTAELGQTLSAGAGAWSGAAITIAIEWLRCNQAGECLVIPGANGPTYELRLEDIGMTIRVRVTATNPAGAAAATTGASAIVLPPAPSLVSAPTISGNALEGHLLTATHGTWTFASSLAVQWRRCTADGASCADIPGATSAAYTPGVADGGFRMQVVVTATNAAGTRSGTSSLTAVVTRVMVHGVPPPQPRPEPESRMQLVVVALTRSPQNPQAGRRFTLTLKVATRTTSVRGAARRVSCSGRIGRRLLASTRSLRAGVARCAWAIPRAAAGKRLRTTIAVSEGSRSARRTVTAVVRPARAQHRA